MERGDDGEGERVRMKEKRGSEEGRGQRRMKREWKEAISL